MSFLKFLKREKKEDELDLPPAPPPLENSQQDFDFNEKFQDVPDFSDIKAPDEVKFDLPDLDMGQEKDSDLPSLPDFEEQTPIPTIRAPTPATVPEPIPIPTPQMTTPEDVEEEQPAQASAKPRRLFRSEKDYEVQATRKDIYVKVDIFRAALGNINIIRNDLRKSEEALMKLENLKSAKDRSFEKVKSSLNDLQKKLIFIDKTLFKGE